MTKTSQADGAASRAGERILIVNADDFGASAEINRGIVETHTDGIVTSASLMVTGSAAAGAASLAARHRRLSVGLHWDLDGVRATPGLDLADANAVRRELIRQLDGFQQLMGRAPTHADSHHHLHRRPSIGRIARALVAPLGIPMREHGPVRFVGEFYGHANGGRTDLRRVSADFLIWILRNEVRSGWTELGCHPGYVSDELKSAYLSEREAELRTLTDPSVRKAIHWLGIRLASYDEFAA